jgi:hypothetical protein
MSDQMRAAWGRRTDTELLHAFFVEELSPQGRKVVSDLVTEKVGSIPDYVAGFATQQGEVATKLRVRACHVDPDVSDGELPTMKGVLVLASNGIGFLPRGRDEDKGGLQFGGILGVASTVLSQMQQTAHPITDLTRLELPVPLLAHVAPSAIWLPHASYDTLLWTANTGEVVRAGERLLSVETLMDCQAAVRTWATRHGIRVEQP